MNNEKLNTKNFLLEKDFETLNQISGEKQYTFSKTLSISNDIFALINEINSLIKFDIETEILINQVIQKINNLINIKGYFATVYLDSKILFEKFENLDINVREYLENSGVLRLAIEEKRSLILSNPEYDLKTNHSNLLIVPSIDSKEHYVIFCLELGVERTETFNRYFSLIELILNLLGKKILISLVTEQNDELRKEIENENNLKSIEINYSTVGKICLKSFHNLKNKTQIVVSSFNLLQKIISDKDEKIVKIFEILNNEIPEFAKMIKNLSELSKTLTNNRKPIYMEFEKFIIDILEFLKLIELTNNINIQLRRISKSKIFGNYELLLQAFLLIFLELYSRKIKELELDTNEDEFRVNVKIKMPNNSKNLSNNLLEDKSNIKFVQIKNLFKQSSCTFLTNSTAEAFEIMISIPKRSSQFNVKNISYAKNFDS